MDFERYTERSRGFVQAAQTLALTRGHQRLTPEHLLPQPARRRKKRQDAHAQTKRSHILANHRHNRVDGTRHQLHKVLIQNSADYGEAGRKIKHGGCPVGHNGLAQNATCE